MDEERKLGIYERAREHVRGVSEHIVGQRGVVVESIAQLRKDIAKERGDEREILVSILIHRLESERQLGYASGSPYFVRCDVRFADEEDVQTLYFGRFPFLQEGIYSWVAPAAAARFESPGEFSYELPDGTKRGGVLLRKDQFMIVDRRIVFLSSESVDYPRELVYQEYFSQQRQGFVLPEIVEQMERAQDRVIRSHYFGSFLIAGAAGSGKTTIALHRVAYLVQSPETEKLFDPDKIVVFVQDGGTKEYFGKLLPELGIYRVSITTYDEWAMSLIGISDMRFVRRFGRTEEEKDRYEYMKRQALVAFTQGFAGGNIRKLLQRVYGDFWEDGQRELFEKQMEKGFLDRFDLTVLLRNKYFREGGLIETVEKWVKLRNGRYVKKRLRQAVGYSLIVVDEAENYLAEQIGLLQSVIAEETKAMVYVGDLRQQTLLWTIKDWSGVGEEFGEERRVVLTKVYRNTRQILEYMQSVGYGMEIPKGIREGKPVVEIVVRNREEEIAAVRRLVAEKGEQVIGVLAKTESYLGEYRRAFAGVVNVRVMTINEAQGVEFAVVFLVGVNRELYAVEGDSEIAVERGRVNRDLLYVGLTRAMEELYVLGRVRLREVVEN